MPADPPAAPLSDPSIARSLTALLASKPVVLADGAMGTSLFAAGLATGEAPELWNLEHPDRVRAVHRGFVAAGSDLVLTNSFGANRCRLALHGAERRVAELNRAAAALARAEADAAGRTVLVAGSIGPTGEIFEPIGALSRADGEAAFAEQAAALADGGCDLLWIETLSAAEELETAVAGAATTGLPIVATMTFDTHGRTMMGLTPAAAMARRAGLAVRPVAFGANCGIGPAQLVESVLGLARAAEPDDLIVAKGNCGIPRYLDGLIHYDGSPAVMAEYACLARDAGAKIIGGCCGTTPVHLRAMAEALAGRPRGPVPDLALIEERLGPLDRLPAAGGEPGRERRSRRRR
jgi:methionine synthase I (cobalamin-dependent)